MDVFLVSWRFSSSLSILLIMPLKEAILLLSGCDLMVDIYELARLHDSRCLRALLDSCFDIPVGEFYLYHVSATKL
jgi:hypothetical protein